MLQFPCHLTSPYGYQVILYGLYNDHYLGVVEDPPCIRTFFWTREGKVLRLKKGQLIAAQLAHQVAYGLPNLPT